VAVTQFRRRTLYSVIEGREVEFRRWLEKAFEHALISLGDDIYKLDWCNVMVSMANRTDRGPQPEHELKKAA